MNEVTCPRCREEGSVRRMDIKGGVCYYCREEEKMDNSEAKPPSLERPRQGRPTIHLRIHLGIGDVKWTILL
jgi:hypothetical protein